MLAFASVYPIIGVSDIAEAMGFYGGTLGLKVMHQGPCGVLYQCGDSMLSIYETEYAGSNEATYATWEVDDIEAEVQGLLAKGVNFERYYDIEGAVRSDYVYTMGDEKAAWFTDPDGNILCLHQLELTV